MSRLVITATAAEGLERCRVFLHNHNPAAMKHAAQTIKEHLSLLQSNPNIGRPLDDAPELRELIIPFGNSGYVGLYRQQATTIYLLAFRHQKEVGY